jgi:hypothetical protein
MQQITRVRQGTDGWRGILARFAQSELTVRAFCQREGISPASFYRWRSVLKGSQHNPLTPKPSRVANPAAGFVELGALSRSGARPASGIAQHRFEVRLDLGGGVLLHLVRG